MGVLPISGGSSTGFSATDARLRAVADDRNTSHELTFLLVFNADLVTARA
jgi:hypothetical protein